jgi:hypothetical protein
VEQLEEEPESKARRAAVEEDLAKTGADKDEEVLRQAKTLLDAIQAHAPETVSAIGVDLAEIKALWSEQKESPQLLEGFLNYSRSP